MEMSIDHLTLAKEVGEILQTFEHGVETVVDEVSKEVANEAVKKLKSTSPVGTGAWKGHYAKKWRVKKVEGKLVVYNEKYQLTHLLENGHDVVSHGRVAGHVDGKPHIKPVEEWVQDEVPKKVEERIRRGV